MLSPRYRGDGVMDELREAFVGIDVAKLCNAKHGHRHDCHDRSHGAEKQILEPGRGCHEGIGRHERMLAKTIPLSQ